MRGMRDTQLHLSRCALGSGRLPVIMASVFSSTLRGASLILAKTLNSIVFYTNATLFHSLWAGGC